MSVSIYKSILDDMAAKVTVLGLTYQAVAIPVETRKLPRDEETLDQCPIICIVPDDRPPSAAPWTTEDPTGAIVKYPTSAVLVMPSNADFTDTDMDLTASFLEQIRRLFQWGALSATLPTGADLFFGEVLPEPLYNREKLAKQYSYSGTSFRHWVSEPRN